MVSAQPVEIWPKNRPTNNRPNKPTTPIPRTVDASKIAGVASRPATKRRFVINFAPSVVANSEATSGNDAAPPLM